MKKHKLNKKFFITLGATTVIASSIISASLITPQTEIAPLNLEPELAITSNEIKEEPAPTLKSANSLPNKEPDPKKIYIRELTAYQSYISKLDQNELYEEYLTFLKTNSNLASNLSTLKLQLLLAKLDTISAYQDYYNPQDLMFYNNQNKTLSIKPLAYLLNLCYQNEENNIYRYFLDNGEPAWFITNKKNEIVYASTYELSCKTPPEKLNTLKDYLLNNNLENYNLIKYTLGDLYITLFKINDNISPKYDITTINTSNILIITPKTDLNRVEGNINPLYILIPSKSYAFGTDIDVYQDIINRDALIKVHRNLKGFEYLDFTNQVSMSSYHSGKSEVVVFENLEELLTTYNLSFLINKEGNYTIAELQKIYNSLLDEISLTRSR